MTCKKNMKTHKRRSKKSGIKGGTKRIDKIYINLGRQHTNPDIRGDIRIKAGPTSHDTDSRLSYFTNFLKYVENKFEEDLAVMLRGPPENTEKQKVYKIIYQDNDAPLEEGSENPIKCKNIKKKKKEDKDETRKDETRKDETRKDETSKDEKKTSRKASKKKTGGDNDVILDVIGAGLQIGATKEALEWRWYWMLLEQRLALNYNDYEWLEKNRNLSISDYNPELFSMDRLIKDFCKECNNNPEYMRKVSKKLLKKYPNFCDKSPEEQKTIIRNLRKSVQKTQKTQKKK